MIISQPSASLPLASSLSLAFNLARMYPPLQLIQELPGSFPLDPFFPFRTFSSFLPQAHLSPSFPPSLPPPRLSLPLPHSPSSLLSLVCSRSPRSFFAPGHTDRAWHVTWSPTEPVVASCSTDKTVRIYRHSVPKPTEGQEGAVLEEPKFGLQSTIATGEFQGELRAVGGEKREGREASELVRETEISRTSSTSVLEVFLRYRGLDSSSFLDLRPSETSSAALGESPLPSFSKLKLTSSLLPSPLSQATPEPSAP